MSDTSHSQEKAEANPAHSDCGGNLPDLSQILRELCSSKERGSSYTQHLATLAHHLNGMQKEMKSLNERIAALENMHMDSGE